MNMHPGKGDKKEKTEAAQKNKAEGRWTNGEHNLFLQGLKIHGKNWKKLESKYSSNFLLVPITFYYNPPVSN